MLGVRFLDVRFHRNKAPFLDADWQAYMQLHSQIERRLRFMADGDQPARRGPLPLRRAAAMTAGRATTGSAIGPTPAFQRGQAHQRGGLGRTVQSYLKGASNEPARGAAMTSGP